MIFTASLLQHLSGAVTDSIKCAFQVYIQYSIEIFFFHLHDQSISGDPGVIHQNVQMSVLFYYVFDHGSRRLSKSLTLHLYTVTAFPPFSSIGLLYFFCTFFRAIVIDDHLCPLFWQSAIAMARADPASCTCDQVLLYSPAFTRHLLSYRFQIFYFLYM